MDRKLTRWIIVTAGLTGTLYLAFLLVANTQEVAAALARMHWKWIATALLLSLVSYGVRAQRWNYYLERLDVRISHRQGWSTYFAGLTMLIMPAIVSGVMKLGLLKAKVDAEVSRILPIPLVERVTDLIGMLLLAATGVLYFGLGYISMGAALLLVITLIYLANHRGLRESLLRRAEGVPWIGKRAHSLRKSLEAAETLMDRESLWVSAIYGVISWGLMGFILWLLLLGIGAATPLPEALFIFALPAILGIISQVPGGVGVEEGGMIALLLQDGLVLPEATAVVLLFRIATLWFGLALGMFSLYFFINSRPREAA